ncbi:hypothetical protein BCR43DRAFT_513617 [Syncephalastrum racemosum]|uniref:FHA domain-containing protein n=1 Tax=Syncephalastrum racemosum TaxID=13706 RepID=A0A1X2HE27_SYNRA|nr:hypothetical protein BCR43DRAFT_513617 [Syncephalastrum racemosum]
MLHLLTQSKDTTEVTCHTPRPDASTTHLYPKLVGHNWDCYITTESIVLGRSSPQSNNGKGQHRVDVDFGTTKRDISRRHAEIRYNARHRRWELRVYGRNGVRVNHALKKPKSGPVTLSTGSVIELVGNRFVFILPSGVSPDPTTPEKQLKQLNPINRHRSLQRAESAQLLRQIDGEGEIEKLILAAFGGHDKRNTRDILSFATRDSPYDETSVLHALLLSQKVQLAERTPMSSLATADEADWILCPSESGGDAALLSSQENDAAEEKTYLSHPPTDVVGTSLHDTYLLLIQAAQPSPHMVTRLGKRRRTAAAVLDRKKARTAIYDLFLKDSQ